MICRIDGDPVDRDNVSYVEVGFGQRTLGVESHRYELTFGKEELLDLLSDEYDEWVRDQRADDELTGDPHPRYFRDLGYPSDIRDFAKHAEYFADALSAFFYTDIFSRSLCNPHSSGVQWIIISIDSVLIENDSIIISGEAFRRINRTRRGSPQRP